MTALKPRTRAPGLQVDTLSGSNWQLSDQHPEHFTLIVFYRGLHCPICKPYLQDLEKKLPEFIKRGTEVIAISCDSQERAQKSKEEWGLDHLQIGYGLTLDQAREWGLYISSSIKDPEPARFAEPGLVLIKPDGTLYAASIQSMPFARPNFRELLAALEFIIENDYPARGEA